MKLYISVILTALLLSLTACRGDSEPDMPGSVDGEPIALTFRMSTGIASRSDNLHEETDSEYPEFEDRIDPNDLAVFVFVKKAGSTDDEKLLLNTKKPHESIQFYLDGAPGQYVINMNVSRTYFRELIGSEVDPYSTENLNFRVVIFANCSTPGTSGNYNSPWTALAAKTFPELISELETRLRHYTLSYLYTDDPVDNYINEIYNQRPIPMYGTNTFIATQKRLFESSPEVPLYLGSLDLLRSVAKVRVVDNIQNKDATGYPKVVGAEIRGTQSYIHQMPYDAVDYVNGTQVHTPNIAEPDKIEPNDVVLLGRLPSSWTMTPANERTGWTFAGYIPEQKIGYANNNVGEGTPEFTIRVAMFATADGSEVIKDFNVAMNGFEGFGTNILRNHIYTLAVTEIFSTVIRCEVDLVPYRGCTLDPYFGL